MDYHHDQIEANIPELGGMVVTSLQEIIQLNSLVAAFRRSALVVHQPPFIAFPRWRGIETDVGLHGDSAGSAIFSGRARGLTGTGSVVIQRTSKFGVLPAKVIAVGFHLQAGFTDRNTIRADCDTMVIRSLSCVTQVEIDVGGDMFTLAQGVHGHRVMSRVQQKRSRL